MFELVRLLLLAAVMYVDDTDLIHWSRTPVCTPKELIAAAQTATYAWGGLAIATGAAIKSEKNKIGKMLRLLPFVLV